MAILIVISVLILTVGGYYATYFFEKHLYNDGLCIKCNQKLDNIMRGDNGEIHQCTGCKRTIHLRVFGTPYSW